MPNERFLSNFLKLALTPFNINYGIYKELRSLSLLNATAAPAFDQSITEMATGAILSAMR